MARAMERLKVDQLHALARDVDYGRRGRINARELHEQMNSCSCLMLVLACVIYWQAREISRLARCRGPEDAAIDVGMLEHVSPIEWDNVILYGQYVLDRARCPRSDAHADRSRRGACGSLDGSGGCGRATGVEAGTDHKAPSHGRHECLLCRWQHIIPESRHPGPRTPGPDLDRRRRRRCRQGTVSGLVSPASNRPLGFPGLPGYARVCGQESALAAIPCAAMRALNREPP